MKQGVSKELPMIIFFLILSIGSIIYSYLKPEKKPKTLSEFYNMAIWFSDTFRKKQAIRIMKEALQDLELNDEEKSTVYLIIGDYYFKIKEFKEANIYYTKMLNIALEKKIRYSNSLINVIKSYVMTGQKERAKELYCDFVNRQSYDKSFIKVKKVRKYLGE